MNGDLAFFKWWLAIVVLVILVISACGLNDDITPPQPRPPVLLAPQRIVLPDYSYHAPRPVYHDVETDAEWPPTPRADRSDTESAK